VQIGRTRKLLLETITTDAGSSFRCFDFQLPFFPFKWHYHPELELTLIVKGSGLRFVGDSIQEFKDGDLCLLGSNTPHTWQSTPRKKQKVQAVVIQFLPAFLGEKFLKLPEARAIEALFDRARRGLCLTGKLRQRIADEMLRMRSQKPGSWARMQSLLALLGAIAESKDCRVLAQSHYEGHQEDSASLKLNTICGFVHDNLQELPPQSHVAKLARLSPPAFSRFFKRHIGKTYANYVNEIRISRACRALLETDAAVTEVALDAGFNNLSNFNRRFREIKRMSPREYRRKAALV